MAKNRRSRSQEEYEAARREGRALGDAPVDEEYHAQMVAVVHTIDELFNGHAGGSDRKTGFVLLVFPFGDTTGRCNFMSNGADRRDIVTLFKEMIARFEGQPEQPITRA
jgi:hypothetical protein